MKIKFLFAVLLSMFLSWTAVAQQHQHNTPATVIDGSVHPELISDEDAYFMFFLVSSVKPDADQKTLALQQDAIRGTKVKPDEYALVTTVLNEFRVQFEALSADYNKAATAANSKGLSYDPTQFVAQRNALVLATRDKLHAGLSTVGLANFQAHVQGFKSRMKVSQ